MKSIIKRSSWILCFRFNQGVGDGSWRTQSEAAKKLGVSSADLSRALKIETLPEELIDLHEWPTSITNYTIRVYREAIAKDGLATILGRIRHYADTKRKLPNRVIVSIVSARITAPRPAPKTTSPKNASDSLPVDLAQKYDEGLLNGQWTTKGGCAAVLNVSTRSVGDAIKIRELPMDVRTLFFAMDLSFRRGRKLLRIAEKIGLSELQARAKTVEPATGIRTPNNVLDELENKHVRPSRYAEIKVRRGRGNKHLVIACEDAKFLLKYRKEIERAIKKVLEKRITDERMVAVKQIIAQSGVTGVFAGSIQRDMSNWLLERTGYHWLVDDQTS